MLNPDINAATHLEAVGLIEEVELWLLSQVSESVERVADAVNWKQAHLLELQRLRRKVQHAEVLLGREFPQVTETAIMQAINLGKASAYKELTELLGDAKLSPIDFGAVAALTETVTPAAKLLSQAVLRAPDDVWREVVKHTAARTVSGAATPRQAMSEALNRYAAQGLRGFVDKAGRNWRLDSYTEMAVRTATNNAFMQGYNDTLLLNDVDLVVVSSHRNPAEVCQPYERQILSLSGDNVGRVTMPDMVGGGEAIVNVKASLNDAIAHGFRHPNCRHRWSAYLPGMPVSPPVHDDHNHEGYRATQQQRYLERQARKWHRVETAAIDDATRAKAKARRAAYQQRIDTLVTEYNLPRRKHRETMGWRTIPTT